MKGVSKMNLYTIIIIASFLYSIFMSSWYNIISFFLIYLATLLVYSFIAYKFLKKYWNTKEKEFIWLLIFCGVMGTCISSPMTLYYYGDSSSIEILSFNFFRYILMVYVIWIPCAYAIKVVRYLLEKIFGA